jgi:hypothetical protein
MRLRYVPRRFERDAARRVALTSRVVRRGHMSLLGIKLFGLAAGAAIAVGLRGVHDGRSWAWWLLLTVLFFTGTGYMGVDCYR